MTKKDSSAIVAAMMAVNPKIADRLMFASFSGANAEPGDPVAQLVEGDNAVGDRSGSASKTVDRIGRPHQNPRPTNTATSTGASAGTHCRWP